MDIDLEMDAGDGDFNDEGDDYAEYFNAPTPTGAQKTEWPRAGDGMTMPNTATGIGGHDGVCVCIAVGCENLLFIF